MIGEHVYFRSLRPAFPPLPTSLPISIPPTLLVSTIGTMPDVARAVTVDAKQPGDQLFVLGWTRPELGGSEYLTHLTETGAAQDWTSRSVPTVDLELSRRCCEAVTRAMDAGLLRTALAVGPGGIAVALSRTLFGGNLGALVDLAGVPVDPRWVQRELTTSELLYSESGGRFLLSVAADDRAALESLLAGLPLGLLGNVTGADERGETRLQVVHPRDGVILDETRRALALGAPDLCIAFLCVSFLLVFCLQVGARHERCVNRVEGEVGEKRRTRTRAARRGGSQTATCPRSVNRTALRDGTLRCTVLPAMLKCERGGVCSGDKGGESGRRESADNTGGIGHHCPLISSAASGPTVARCSTAIVASDFRAARGEVGDGGVFCQQK